MPYWDTITGRHVFRANAAAAPLAVARSARREFDLRSLFQMSPAGSSELCDSTVASNLGLHKALLAVESDGTLEKFRPYTMPDAEWLEKVKQLLKKKKKSKRGG